MTAVLDRPAAPRRRVPGWPGTSTRPVRRPTRRPGRRPAGRPASPLHSAVTMVALVTCWGALQLLVLSGLSHEREQALLYSSFRGDLAGATAPLGPVVPPGEPVALLEVPRLEITEVVVEGTASGDLLTGPGHKRDTVLPGQVGVAQVYGRAATYGAPFARLPEVRVGDSVAVTMAQGRIDLDVIGVRRDGDPLPIPPADGVARLTLVTAEGEGRLSAIAPERTVYVDAEAPEGFPAPPGRATAVPAAEEAMAADTTATPLLALCLALLVALTLGVIGARQRHPLVLVWVVASPVAIALAWFTTDVVVRLLPNLI